MHSCPECGLGHDEPGTTPKDPMVEVAKIEAGRDVEVAKIAAGVSRDEMMREIEGLRAELLVRREEPPVAETEITQVTAEVDAEPEEPAVMDDMPVPEPEPEGPPAPPETEPVHQEEKRSKGWFS
jgi:hypothetical protein